MVGGRWRVGGSDCTFSLSGCHLSILFTLVDMWVTCCCSIRPQAAVDIRICRRMFVRRKSAEKNLASRICRGILPAKNPRKKYRYL